MKCYCSIVICQGYFMNSVISEIFESEEDMFVFIVDYLRGPEGQFFFNIDLNAIKLPKNIDALNILLKKLIDNDEIIVRINAKYITE